MSGSDTARISTCLGHKRFVEDVGDDVVGHVEAHECLVELEAVINGGNPRVCDGEAGDVGVEGDGHHVQGPGGARDTQSANRHISIMLLHISMCRRTK